MSYLSFQERRKEKERKRLRKRLYSLLWLVDSRDVITQTVHPFNEQKQLTLMEVCQGSLSTSTFQFQQLGMLNLT